MSDIEDEISSWGYAISPAQYERSLQSSSSRTQPAAVGGRGRGILNPNHMAKVRLAAEINDLKKNRHPMGYMPTSRELLESSAENEITPMLRQLGISSSCDDDVSSSNTRRQLVADEDIHIDHGVPVILKSELFNIPRFRKMNDEALEKDDTFDPDLPIEEQFSTIPELAVKQPDSVQPQRITKPEKANVTVSSNDSGVASCSRGSMDESIKSKPKTKKKKWRKMTGDELVPTDPEKGRYEEVYSVGVHESTPGSAYCQRQLYGADGVKGWSTNFY
ncbi:uncharacterized protein LOC129744569 [Uranotaenia lowii]|uniref:uncharacterized protein LOC129744569 n=1 Tax=Uranotaenia lowii TaxID=190385 RepID=UPI00247AD57D|nr:uncharacterized protein LOC129744569 [Uranotaenia lowii]